MAGTFPGVSGTQQQDVNGEPLAGGILTIYVGGTNDFADVFQDIGLVLTQANPLIADNSGRIPLFFVADGTYRVRLTDQYGSTSNGGFDYLQVPSIGASSSGGGGTPVDPTTIATTGDCKWRLEDGILSGWTRMNARTIGSAISGASERANSDCEDLFTYLWNTFSDAQCPVAGGRGVSASADWAANKKIATFDMRGRGPFGMDTMGNTAANRLVGATFSSGSSSAIASLGGEGSHALTVAELAEHAHGGETGSPTTFPPNDALPATGAGALSPAGANSRNPSTLTSSNLVDHVHSIPLEGGGLAHNTMPPFALVTWFMKL